MYIERDIRRTVQGETEPSLQSTFPMNSEYMQSTLDLLVRYMTLQAPLITSKFIRVLFIKITLQINTL